MRNIFFAFIAIVTVSAARANEKCFDPRVTFFQCAEGTTFVDWIQGDCEDGLVEDALCESDSKTAKECFDPRLTTFQCKKGTTFKGWIQGDCEDGLVQDAICKAK
ncbi:hypothetical protein K2X05_09925 [bacterium]|nr:hypothetical protein [bacterium]